MDAVSLLVVYSDCCSSSVREKAFSNGAGKKNKQFVGASVSMCWCLSECLTGFHFLAVASGVLPVFIECCEHNFSVASCH